MNASLAILKIYVDTTHETVRIKDQGTETDNDLFSIKLLLRNNLHPPF
ncbi:uncharacterized protein METZ01_LOCUS481536, partial [marine metagenome]